MSYLDPDGVVERHMNPRELSHRRIRPREAGRAGEVVFLDQYSCLLLGEQVDGVGSFSTKAAAKRQCRVRHGGADAGGALGA